eukprot:TRINITY_DN285_c0_g1_i2.p1 TRINITY_DN285_c0_g1~~TRINITY_DN285_c0_g1_i2.p1  ORF type:complete len:174 (+),score=41.76 TRINITY_DN285_c0_g1_i2:128-649(+)
MGCRQTTQVKGNERMEQARADAKMRLSTDFSSEHREVVTAVLADILSLNPGVSEDKLKAKLFFNQDGSLKSWDLSGQDLSHLPESFGTLQVEGGLYLYNNWLVDLPESFGSLRVGGDLDLYGNIHLSALPESFGNLRVGGVLSLPEQLKKDVGGRFALSETQLQAQQQAASSC